MKKYKELTVTYKVELTRIEKGMFGEGVKETRLNRLKENGVRDMETSLKLVGFDDVKVKEIKIFPKENDNEDNA